MSFGKLGKKEEVYINISNVLALMAKWPSCTKKSCVGQCCCFLRLNDEFYNCEAKKKQISFYLYISMLYVWSSSVSLDEVNALIDN